MEYFLPSINQEVFRLINVKYMIRAVVFDFGGVLAEEGFREGLKSITRKNGLKVSLQLKGSDLPIRRETEKLKKLKTTSVLISGCGFQR
jgi:hypothetical protein